jgi:putative protease
VPGLKLPELLAPAGSPEALKAAVSAGADAVYMSGKRFGARKYATNFDQKELNEAVDYAHLRKVKVYVTVNTLIRDDELQDVARYLLWLYEISVDAVLVQDVGVAALARRIVPELDLHASTQMTIHNQPGASWAKGLGMKRAVLAREVSLEEAEEIARNSKIDLEVFVHGALCYCYSGQCLLSSVIGGRSGNRGMCAQPCRKPYVLLRGDSDEYARPVNLAALTTKDRFLLSTRDLAIYSNLNRIVKSPIQSFKIEGRMKSAEYVAIVTSIYRKSLDAIAKGSWSPSIEDQRDLALAFNRDFTGGYLAGSKEIMSREMSDNRGFFIGSVASYDVKNGEAAVRLESPMVAEQGDGLVFQSPGQELGMVVHRPPSFKDGLLKLRTPDRVKPGARVYLTSSIKLRRQAERIVSSARPQIPIDLVITWDDGVPTVEGRLMGPKGPLKIEVKAGFRMEKALSKPLTKEKIDAQLRKTGGTPFFIRKTVMNYPGDLFVPLGSLNQLRRDILLKAEATLLNAYRPNEEKVIAAKEEMAKIDLTAAVRPEESDMAQTVPSLAIYADNLETIRGALDGGCGRFYFEPLLKGSSQKEIAKELISLLKEAKNLCSSVQLIWKWPRITKDRYLKFAIPLLARLDSDGIAPDGVMVEGIGAAEAVFAVMPKMPLSGSASLNIWNHLTVVELGLSPPFQRLTLSPELSSDQLARLVAKSHLLGDAPEFELMVQGNLEVMVAEDCLPCAGFKDAIRSTNFWGLQDFKRMFPFWLDNDSRTHVQNAAETCLVDYMPQLFEIGLDGIAIDARGRTEKYAREMAGIYLEAINLSEKGGPDLKANLKSLKEKARAISLGGITAGHFVKGLKDELPNLG